MAETSTTCVRCGHSMKDHDSVDGCCVGYLNIECDCRVVAEANTEIVRLRELVETAFSEGYYAGWHGCAGSETNETGPYQPHWKESSARAALKGER